MNDLQNRQLAAGLAVTRDQAIIRLRKLREETPEVYTQIRADYQALSLAIGHFGHQSAYRTIVKHADQQDITIHALLGALGAIERLGEEEGLKTQLERTEVKRILGKL